MPRNRNAVAILAVIVFALTIGVSSRQIYYYGPGVMPASAPFSCAALPARADVAIRASCATAATYYGIRDGAIAAAVGGLAIFLVIRRKRDESEKATAGQDTDTTVYTSPSNLRTRT